MTSKILTETIERLTEDIRRVIQICPRASDILQFDVGKAYRDYGLLDDASSYINVVACVPVESLPNCGLPMFVNPKALFKDYQQLESGIAIPKWLAEKSGLKHQQWDAPETVRILVGYLSPKDLYS